MKKVIFILVLFLPFIWSCSPLKDSPEECDYSTDNKEQAFRDFAIILSKATYNEPLLRLFLKEEALKQIDHDYDVFYPWTKNCLIDGQRSFRDVLVEYDEDNKLPSIEESLPILTILIPDWSWIHDNCFSINAWNTDDCHVRVCVILSRIVHTCYTMGKKLTPSTQGRIRLFPYSY